eukprot:133148_1
MSYDSDHNNNNGSKRTKQRTLPEGSKLGRMVASKVCRAPDVMTLYPYQGNMHEFIAGKQGAAVLDVLLPPYDIDHDRDCTFYHEEEQYYRNYHRHNHHHDNNNHFCER